MLKNDLLAKSVRFALIGGAATAALSVAPVFAAEDKEKVERIEVTGSRIKRTDLEGASPVTVITTEDLKVEGNFTVADALRNSNLNSFGSFSERSGSSAQSQATINLRGAGSARTLVLIDGKRFPGSPTLGGASANLNAIPLSAVERIEILTDGASSVYGSDAIAGVVNIIMKKDYEGIEFNIGGGSRTQDDGLTSKEFSIVAGYQTDKGSLTFSFDHQDRKGISDGARDYTAAKMSDANGDGVIQAYTETDGWSIYGATIAAPDFSETKASPLCDTLIEQYGEDTFRKVAADDDWSAGSEYCMFAYGNVSYNKASVDRNTVYVDSTYEIADDVEWFGRIMFTQNESFGRYAPPAAAWNNIAADSAHNPYGEETTGYFRWVGIGNRDGAVTDYNQDYLTGLKGTISSWNDAEWEFYYHYNKADNRNVGRYYLSYAGLAYNEQNDIPLDSEEGVANMKATTLTEDSSEFHQYFAGLGFEAGELSGGAIGYYAGVEYFQQSYASIYDAQSEAGRIGGSAGNSAQGERDVTALFIESVLPVTDDLEVNLAVRYDDYSDFGDELSPKASVRYQAAENLVLRASYSEAFRAPSLDQLHAATTYSAQSGQDNPGCAVGLNCSTRQIDTYISSNKNLGAETSEYINLGLAWDVVDNFGIKLDYFNLSIDNVITELSNSQVIKQIHDGSLTPDETFYVKRAPATGGNSLGRVLEVGTGSTNNATLEIEGVDLNLNGNFETSFGDFTVNWSNSYVIDYNDIIGKTTLSGKAIPVDTAGWSGTPDYKSNITLGYAIEDHRISWNVNYTHGTYEDDLDYKPFGHLNSWTIHNVSYIYNAGDYGRILLGVNNLFDEDPVLSSDGKFENASLYNNFGREYRATYTIKF